MPCSATKARTRFWFVAVFADSAGTRWSKMIAIFEGSHGRAGRPVPSWISRNWLITRTAFSCDIARSTRGSTTSPARRPARPAGRARIFSTAVAPTSTLNGGADDDGRPLLLRLDPLLRQEVFLECPVFRKADEVGELPEARNEIGSPFEETARRRLQRPEEVQESAVYDHDRRHRNRDAADAELLQLRNRHEIGLHAGDPVHLVDGERSLERGGRLLDVAPAPDPVNEGEVGPGREIQVAAADRLVEAVNRISVRPGVDDEVGIEPVADARAGADFSRHLLGRNGLLAGHVTAALREDLILDVHARHAHCDEPLRDPRRVHGVAAASVDVGHDGDRDCLRDVPGQVENILHRNEADIGLSHERGGEAEARHLDRLETRRFDDPGAERVMATRHDDRSPLEDGVLQDETLLHGISFQSLGSACATASPISRHVEAPPMSYVRTLPSRSTFATAASTARPFAPSPSQSSIIFAARIVAIGLTLFWPACFGAEPCDGSKTASFSPMFPEAAKPRPPTIWAQRSEMMSP